MIVLVLIFWGIFILFFLISALVDIPSSSMGLPWWLSDGKESDSCVGDSVSIPGSARSPGEGNDNPLQFSCLEFHEQRNLAGYSLWGCKELDATEQRTHTHRHVPAEHKGSLFSMFLPTFVISCFFGNSHSYRCEVIFYCSFDVHFPDYCIHLTR